MKLEEERGDTKLFPLHSALEHEIYSDGHITGQNTLTMLQKIFTTTMLPLNMESRFQKRWSKRICGLR